jgi:hypothetical protein
MAHRVVVGHETAVASVSPSEAVPVAGAEVQGAGSSDHADPFQSSTDVPTTATHFELVGHEIPILPVWYNDAVELDAPVPVGAPMDWVGSQLPSR